MLEFIDKSHEIFFKEKFQLISTKDCYTESLIYILGICPDTRENFDTLFDIKNEEINISGLEKAWQTSTSLKVTRLAFNLFNDCIYDSDQDFKEQKISTKYTPSEIFCCNYARFFYQGIQLRHSSYTKTLENKYTEKLKEREEDLER